jgi:hypothetical protein
MGTCGINEICFAEDKSDSVCNSKGLYKIGNISKYQAMNVPYMHWDIVYVAPASWCLVAASPRAIYT